MRNMFLDIWTMLIDPTYSISMLGSALACISLSLIGVIYSLRRSALVGEVIAHSAFPGLILGGFIGIYLGVSGERMSLLFLLGAIITGHLSMKKLAYLQKRWDKSADSSLMMSISAFLGIGILLASIMQTVSPVVYKDVVIFLYGRVATMLKFHAFLYAMVTMVLLAFILSSHRRIKVFEFDKVFASTLGIGKWLDKIVLFITLVVVIISLRSCGILLLSGMMTTPAIAARWWVKRMSSMFILAALFGGVSAITGSYLSLYLGDADVTLPTGPMITVVSASITVFSILFGPRAGVVLCAVRRISFSIRCREENILKALYKKNGSMTFKEMKNFLNSGVLLFVFVLLRLRKKVTLTDRFSLDLKQEGKKAAARIIRLHRLWEVYLFEVGFTKNRVHVFAEEIEHVLTDEMEEILVKRLNNPTHCPHKQEIPAKTEVAFETS
ncbi:MAG: Manganese transport system membrane protein MntC [Chlamydiia bacterium]|nr:Manganese transport system membrane protein MntC [Chlamydiia bacterium]MCH9618684.1 Manganese transport system membrane protein MntC [Chlamydiia bacterium]MCH9624413.1 Manganese transport system membrane protein MntC [Chlamydiia bacterium]